PQETTMTTKTQTTAQTATMPAHQRHAIAAMDSGELCDFQIRLQVECGMSDAEAASYIAQAFAE
ncbi:hypothetical protein LCGC14_1150590, partial [marine sediment metagenome]